MKVRLTDGMIRLRLQRVEVESLLARRSVAIRVTTSLSVEVAMTETDSVAVDLETHHLRLHLPARSVREPDPTNPILFDDALQSSDGPKLRVLVELDLKTDQ